jgi:retron-type reverse transcriptase
MVWQWMKSGVVENGRFTPTEDRVPQVGLISPQLLNIALHGMETLPESATTSPAPVLARRSRIVRR